MKPTQPPPKFSADVIRKQLDQAQEWILQAAQFATALDDLGAAGEHPPGSDARQLCEVRDGVDLVLSRFVGSAGTYSKLRAERTRSVDLLVEEFHRQQGDFTAARRLMERYHALEGPELNAEGEPDGETLPAMVLWDTYLRVSALPRLLAQYPRHLRHNARLMHGWPINVAHHLDHRPEFERIAALMELGRDYPLDAGPRKRKGVETPLLRYLEPLVWRLHVLRQELTSPWVRKNGGNLADRISGSWRDYRDPKPAPELVAVLERLAGIPPLTRGTAVQWSREVITPVILLTDAKDRETCAEESLRNIWRHRAVKSRATFKSRLHSAVTDTLQRFARPD